MLSRLEVDGSPMCLHDTAAHRQAQAGPLRLRGEQRLEDSITGVDGYAGTVVEDPDLCATSVDGGLRAGRKQSVDEQFEWNVHLESFLVHARNLMVFLHWVDKKDPRDVRAADFIREWRPAIPEEPWLEGVYQQVSGRIVHLSYERKLPPEDWPIRSIAETLEKDVLRFIAKAPTHLTDEQWHRPSVRTFSTYSDRWVTGFTGTVELLTLDSFFTRRRRGLA